MANLLSKTWRSLIGGATVHKYSGDGTSVSPSVPHVIVDSAPSSGGVQYVSSTTGTQIIFGVGGSGSVAPSSPTRTWLSITNVSGGSLLLGVTGMAYGTGTASYLYSLSAGDTLEVPSSLVRLGWSAYSLTGNTIYRFEGS